MNSTFMFDEDRFGADENFSIHYQSLGGTLPPSEVNRLIRDAYAFLDKRYPDPAFRHQFPSLESALHGACDGRLDQAEISRLCATFSHHELGHIPKAYAAAVKSLARSFRLAAVIDIWAPKDPWLEAFSRAGLTQCFAATSFSSDHGMVKPSPRPFQMLLRALNVPAEEALMIGDSVRRDLGGALAANIDCVLVGGAEDSRALACSPNLLEFAHSLATN